MNLQNSIDEILSNPDQNILLDAEVEIE